MTAPALGTAAGPVQPVSLFEDIATGKTGVGAGNETRRSLFMSEGLFDMFEMIEDLLFGNMQLCREIERGPAVLFEQFDNLLTFGCHGL